MHEDFFEIIKFHAFTSVRLFLRLRMFNQLNLDELTPRLDLDLLSIRFLSGIWTFNISPNLKQFFVIKLVGSRFLRASRFCFLSDPLSRQHGCKSNSHLTASTSTHPPSRCTFWRLMDSSTIRCHSSWCVWSYLCFQRTKSQTVRVQAWCPRLQATKIFHAFSKHNDFP